MANNIIGLSPTASNPAVTLTTGVVARGDGLSGPFLLDLQSAYETAAMTTVVTGGPTVTVQLQGSMNGSTWVTLATSTSATGDTQFSTAGNQFTTLRVNVSAASGGTAPTIAVSISAFSPGSGAASQTVAGTVTANQGTKGAVANAWPVVITNGASNSAAVDGNSGLLTRFADPTSNTSANVAAPTGGSVAGNQGLVSTGVTTAGTSLAALTTGNGTTIDFGSAKGSIVFAITANGTISAGQVQMQVSVDGTTWFSPPAGALVNFSAATLANPYVLVTATNALFGITNNGAFRYARVNVSTNVTGAGGSATALVSAA